MQNAFRDVNIALVNEFSHLADYFGVNVWEAIAVANRHPRAEFLHPDPSARGQSISVDPWLLIEAVPGGAKLIHQARLVNDEQPAYAVARLRDKVGDLTGRGSRYWA